MLVLCRAVEIPSTINALVLEQVAVHVNNCVLVLQYPRLALFHIFILICARAEFPVCSALQFVQFRPGQDRVGQLKTFTPKPELCRAIVAAHKSRLWQLLPSKSMIGRSVAPSIIPEAYIWFTYIYIQYQTLENHSEKTNQTNIYLLSV